MIFRVECGKLVFKEIIAEDEAQNKNGPSNNNGNDDQNNDGNGDQQNQDDADQQNEPQEDELEELRCMVDELAVQNQCLKARNCCLETEFMRLCQSTYGL